MDSPTPTVDAPSKPPKRFRRTRIAVSVFFGVMTVALVVLWGRSYSHMDIVNRNDGVFTTLGINNGYAYLKRSLALGLEVPPRGWKMESTAANGTLPRFRWRSDADGISIAVPFWSLALVAVTAALLPIARLQFGLRGLFVLTTLVAVVLGLVCYTVR